MSEEPRDRAALESLQLERLRRLVSAVRPRNRFASARLGPKEIRSLEDLAQVPFTTKQELLEDQAAHPPYGTNLTGPVEGYMRMHRTSGTHGRPLLWLDDRESWEWFLSCWQKIYDLAAVKPADRILFAFSFGPFIGFWAAFEGAQRRGTLCIAGGGMGTAARLRLLEENQATVVCCTPTYALRMAEVAAAEKIDLPGSPVRALIVAGEPGGSIPSTRERIEKAWGARLFDHYGMTEIGSLGMECVEQPGGFHLLETECIAEVIDSATGARLPDGLEGELVLTNLGRTGSPLFRYRTGDRVVVDPRPCPCGRVFKRLKGGVLGRADDMLIIRGNNVYPGAVEAVVRRFPEVEEFRIVVRGPELRLEVELRAGSSATGLPERIIEEIRRDLLFRPEVAIVPPGALPRAEMKSQRVVRAP